MGIDSAPGHIGQSMLMLMAMFVPWGLGADGEVLVKRRIDEA